MRYEVDEEVIFVGAEHCLKGEKGKLVGFELHFDGRNYLVEFYIKHGKLHNGLTLGELNNLSGKPNHCWWCTANEILDKKDYLEYELDGRHSVI